MEQFHRYSRKNYSFFSCLNLQTVLSLCGRGSKGSLFFPRSRYIYTAPKRLIEKVIPNKNHLSLVFFTELSTSYATMPSISSVLCATLNTFLEKQKLCAQACPASKKGAGQPQILIKCKTNIWRKLPWWFLMDLE